jgi:predicted lipoprotein with Yx(FWY)xxD motif
MSRAALLSPALLWLATSVGCGDASSRTAATSLQTTAQQSRASDAPPAARLARPAAVTVKTAASRYGMILVDRKGRTLYLFTRDPAGRTRCYGACARAWPPYTVTARGTSGPGARARLIGLVRRSDGSRQLTYNGHPLYYYVGDRLPGQILCQDVEEYGGHWWVVSPAGTAVTGHAPPC